jgi:hypothetical protein
VTSSPHNRLRSLARVPSFPSKYSTRHIRPLSRRASPALYALVDAHYWLSLSNSPPVHHSCIHGSSLSASTCFPKAVKLQHSHIRMSSQSVSSNDDTLVYNGPAMMKSTNVRQLSGSTFAYPEIWHWNFSNENEWPSHRPSAR